ncbi:Elastase inhibitor AFLEI Flags: Precursor [Pseudoxanthomonas kalamensis DSM 18571]|uniref:I78 family peptidase inhibitor n=1 Tax=Pseudoxanthomonas kalamensis TaxID=289483 RepID=UPI001391028D|nr:I78 family peptidase inhibitor [Pseudoxanthomonas kalamensis]KAF1712286.1 Elastase inhibitor AFLEI Flags: Precursor [Pseudoxanthomonas kalamensis DSM 18571]
MTRSLFACCLLGLAACSAPVPDEQERALVAAEQRAEADATLPPVAEPVDAASCDAVQAQWTVGKTLTEAEVDQARQDAGAQVVRTLKPNQPVTMDFNAARLNIELDEQGAVVSIRCG